MDVQLIVSLPLYYSNKSIVLVPQYYVIVLMLYSTAIMYHMLFRCILYTSFYNYNNNNFNLNKNSTMNIPSVLVILYLLLHQPIVNNH